MAYYALVIDDAEKATEAKRRLREVGLVRAGVSAPQAGRIAQVQESPQVAGALWTHMEDACPDGLPNCRKCGDPAFAVACAAAGHCPHCGTAHGIAPDSVLAAHGVVLKAMEPPASTDQWDAKSRRFRPEP